ncbi:Nuclear import receptor [Umbelopsis nana]
MAYAAVSRVTEALNTLYSGQDSAAKKEASQWLESFQKTPDAWSAADYLIKADDSNLETKLFAAQTFRQKITFDLKELDEPGRVSLRDSLLALLSGSARSGPPSITTQLCLSMAILAIQMPQWKNVVAQFVELFGKSPETIPALLEFLTVLPEEVNNNNRIPIGDEEFRARATELLTDNSDEILKLLAVYIQSSGTQTVIQNSVFKCLSSWLRTGDIDVNKLATNPLLDLVFTALKEEELFDVAVDVICEIIYETKDVQDYMPMIQIIYPKLVPLYQDLAIVKGEDDEDKFRGYCRIFVEAGEAYLLLLVAHQEAFSTIIDGIAVCTAYHDLDIVPMTFNFWFELANALTTETYCRYQPHFVRYFDQLVDVMIKHLQYPEDSSDFTSQDRDEFRQFRHHMGDTLKDCCRIVGSHRCLSKPLSVLSNLLAGGTTSATWQQIEAPIFSLRAMGSEIPDEENEIMPQIMEFLSKLPHHPKIRYAATLVISRYTTWTRKHPEFLAYQLNFISAGFENEEVAAASALALKHLCKDCSELLVDYLSQLHPFYINVGKTLPILDILEVTEAVAHVIAVIPTNELLKALQLFCLPLAQNLHDLAVKGKDATEKDRRDAADLLEQINIFLQVIQPNIPVNETHPCVAFINELWPVFDLCLANFGSDQLVSESLCKVFKTCVISYRMHFVPLIPQLLQRIVNVFSQTGMSAYLWVAGRTIREYAIEGSDGVAPCLELVEQLSSPTFTMFGTKSFDDIPDVVEEYFRMLVCFLTNAPSALVQSPLLSSIFQAGLAALNVQQMDAINAILTFHRTLLDIGAPNSQITPKVSPRGSSDDLAHYEPVLSASELAVAAQRNATVVTALFREFGLQFTNQLFDGLINHFPRDVVPDVAAIQKILVQLLPAECGEWMITVVENFPVQTMTAAERQNFLTDYTKAIQDQQWQKVRRVLTDFVNAYRRKHTSRHVPSRVASNATI